MKGWWTEESLGAILIHLWMTAHVMCLSATITEALTRGVGPCEVSISACVPNYVIWKGQRHIKAKLRSLQPLLQLYRRLLMHSDATAGKEDWMWIIISTKGSCAMCACVLNAYKCEPFSSSQKPPPLMYYTEQRPEWSRVGWKRSEGIMHFCSPHWRCIEFYFSQWLDKITFKSLSFYCDWFFFFRGQYDRSLKQKLWKHSSDSWGKTCGWICDFEFTSYFSSFIYFFIHKNTRGTVKEKRLRKISVSSKAQVPYAWHPLKKNQMKKTNEF